MAHPVNSINYLLQEWEWLQSNQPYPYFAFILFGDEHTLFRQFFIDSFADLDEWSGNGCMFFAIAPPPENWLQIAKGRDYWQHFMANSVQAIGYDNDAVKQVARYFSVPYEHLPAIIFFQDLKRDDVCIVRLGDFDREELRNFFYNLFAILRQVADKQLQDLYLWVLKRLVNAIPFHQKQNIEWLNGLGKLFISPSNRRQKQIVYAGKTLPLHDFAYHTSLPEPLYDLLSSLQHELERLTIEVAQLREEQRSEFVKVHIKLERIEVVLQETVGRIDEFRRSFVQKWVSIEDIVDTPNQLREVREQLHTEFDAFLMAQSRHLAERLYEIDNQELPQFISPIESLLENETRVQLITSEMLWRHLSRLSVSVPIDFSVCGIGLWKSIEVEVNRTFVDSLRVWNKICNPGQSSINQPHSRIMGNLSELGVFRARVENISISKRNFQTGNLLNLDLGEVSALLGHSKFNSLSGIINSTVLPVPQTDTDAYDFLNKLSVQIGRVAREFRNSHAHIQVMTQGVCSDFRTFLTDTGHPHNPLLATLTWKDVFLKNNLI